MVELAAFCRSISSIASTLASLVHAHNITSVQNATASRRADAHDTTPWRHLRANRSPPNVSSHIAAVSPPGNALQHETPHKPFLSSMLCRQALRGLTPTHHAQCACSHICWCRAGPLNRTVYAPARSNTRGFAPSHSAPAPKTATQIESGISLPVCHAMLP